MKKFLLSFLIINIICYTDCYSQSRTIIGKVVDEKGNGIPGVSVLVVGTNSGTSTGSDGAYSINIPPGFETLEFRFIGYSTKTVEINNKSTINLKLPSLESKYWCCTSHKNRVHCNQEKKVLKASHPRNEVYVRPNQ